MEGCVEQAQSGSGLSFMSTSQQHSTTFNNQQNSVAKKLLIGSLLLSEAGTVSRL